MGIKSQKRVQDYKTEIPSSIIASKWLYPLEAFTPHPSFTEPLVAGPKTDINLLLNIAKNKLNNSEVILAHETTPESAIEIMNYGFDESEQGSCNIRDNAIFGWIHEKDIGYFEKSENPNATHIVLFSAPRNNVFVSSYTSSAKQLILGDINGKEYENKHVLSYTDYESLQWCNPEIIEHLDYQAESLLPSK